MTTINDISWSRYKYKKNQSEEYEEYEGPMYIGKHKYELPDSPDFLDKALCVFVSTEGGHYDSLNMYDRCIVSLGLIQRCEVAPIFGTSEMLGKCAEMNKDELNKYMDLLPSHPTFQKTKTGWRFFQDGVEISTKQAQQKLFLSTNGLRGSWNNESIEYARTTASVLCSICENKIFRYTQTEYAKSMLMKFVYGNAKDVLFTKPDEDGWWGALKAAYISFAGNLPSVANNCIRSIINNGIWDLMDDKDKCTAALQSLVFDSEISIWPDRYNAIRPQLERLFGIDLPDFANELKQWNKNYQYGRTIYEVQASLQHLGYDIGPEGVNGKLTRGTTAAITEFKKDQKLSPDSVLDVITVELLHEMIESMDSITAGRLIDLSNSVMNGKGDDISSILEDITNRQKKSPEI